MKREKLFTKRFIMILLAFVVVLAAVLAIAPTLARYIRGTSDLENEFGSKGSKNPTVVVNGEQKTDDDGYLDENGELTNVSFYVGKTDYPVYVRVKVLVTWKSIEEHIDADGKKHRDVFWVSPKPGPEKKDDEDAVEGGAEGDPEENGETDSEESTKPAYDYEVSYNTSAWELGNDGYWYYIGGDYNGVVASQGTTSALVESFKYMQTEPPQEGYELNVEFIVQTVQAVGHTDGDGNGNGEILARVDAWKYYFQTEHDSGEENGSDNG